MSRQVDERVVQMKFDKKDFEKNVSETITVLEKLKEKLNFKGLEKSFQDIESASNKVTLSGLTKSAEAVEVKFSMMSLVAMNAINRIVDTAMTAGTQLVKSLSFDQITSGFSKFEEVTKSYRTIMSATGQSVKETEPYMEKLSWFTDETSYSLTDMTANIAKFTANKVPLEDAVTAMQGIATWAANSGQGINEASRAMYNLSQAIGAGSVQLIDWRSIEFANMGTAEFKQTVMDTAVELGTLKKVGDKYLTTQKGTAVSIENFRETLSEDWFSSDVLLKTLGRYGEYADAVYDIWKQNDGLVTTSDIIEQLGDNAMELGYKAFKSAQEYRTFGDAISATKDAVSSGWLRTFQIIIGNADEVVDVWTNVGNALYDIFAAGSADRNAMLKSWRELGGRDDLFKGIAAAWETISKFASVAKDAFNEMFPPMTAERLKTMTENMRKFFESLKLSDEAAYTLKVAIKALLLPVKLLWQVFRIGFAVVQRLAREIWKLADSFLGAFAKGNPLEDLFRRLLGDQRYERAAAALSTIFEKLGTTFSDIRERVKDAFGDTKPLGVFKSILDKVGKALEPITGWMLDKLVLGLEAIAKLDFSQFTNFVQSGLNGLTEFGKKVGDYFGPATESVGTLYKNLKGKSFKQIIQTIGKSLIDLRGNFTKFIEAIKVKNIIDSIAGVVDNMVAAFNKAGESVTKFTSGLTPSKILLMGFGASLVAILFSVNKAITSASKVMDGFTGVMSSLSARLKPRRLNVMAETLLVVAASLVALSLVDSAKLKSAAIAVGSLMASLTVMSIAMAAVSKFMLKGNTDPLREMAKSLLVISSAILMLSLALVALNAVDINTNLIAKIGVLGAVMAALVLVAKFINKSSKDLTKMGFFIVGFSVGVLIIVNSLSALASMNLGSVLGNLGTLLAIMGLMAIIGKTAKNVKFGGAVGLTVLSISLLVLAKVLKRLAKEDVGKLMEGLIGYIPLFAVMTTLALAARIAGQNAAKAGIGFILIAASMVVLAQAVKQIAAVDLAGVVKATASMSILMIFMAVITALATRTEEAGKNMKGIGKSLLVMSLAIGVLSFVIKSLGAMDTKEMLKGVGAVSVIMLFFALIAKVGKNVKGAFPSIFAMTLAIGTLTTAMMLLTLVPERELIVSAAALSAGIIAFGAAMRLMSKIKFGSLVASILLAIVVLEGIREFVQGVSGIDSTTILASCEGLSLAILAFAGASRLMSGAKLDFKDGANAAGIMALFAMEVIAAMAVLQYINGDGMLEKVTAFSVMTLALASAAKIMSGAIVSLNIIGGSAGNTIKMGASMAVVVGVLGAVGMLFVHFASQYNLTTDGLRNSMMVLAAITPVIVVFGAVAAALSKLKIDVALATKGALAIAAVIAVLGVTVGLLGGIVLALDNLTNGGATDALLKGIEVFQVIGEAIGKLIGSLYENVVSGLITGVATGLDNFASAVTRFLDAMKGVDSTSLGIVDDIVTMLLKLTAASLVNNISNFIGIFTGGTSLKALGDQLVEFAGPIKDFCAQISTIPPENIASAVSVAGALGELLGAIPSSGGLWQKVFGSKSLEIFSGLGTFGKNFREYYNEITNGEPIDEAIVTASANAAKSLVELNNSLPNTGGKLQVFLGQPDLALFGANLKVFAEGFRSYYNEITKDGGIDYGVVRSSANAAQALADLNNTLPKTDGVLQAWIGSQDLGAWGKSLVQFGSYLKRYYNVITHGGQIDEKVVKSSANAAQALSDLNSTIPTEDGFIQGLFGEKDLGTFGLNILTLATGLKDYSVTAKDINTEAMENANTAVTKLIDLSTKLNENTTWATVFGVDNNFGSFGIGLTSLGGALKSYNDSVSSGISWYNVGQSLNSVERAAAVAKDMNGISTAGMHNLGYGMKTMAEVGLQAFSDVIAGSDDKIADLGNAMIDSLIAGIEEKAKDIRDAGADVVDGFMGGMSSKVRELQKAGKSMARIVERAARISISSHSQPKTFEGIGRNVVEGFANGISDNAHVANDASREVGNNVVKTFQSTLEIHSPSRVMRDEVGRYIVEGIAEGISSDMSAEEAASQKAQNIVDAFSREFEKIDLDVETLDLEYQLWEILNATTANSAELSTKQTDLLHNKLQLQADYVKNSYAEYLTTLQVMGKETEETQQAYNKYLQAQYNMVELSQQYADIQNKGVVDQRQAWKTYSQLMVENWESLKSVGFSQEEIEKWARDQAGVKPEGFKETTAKDVMSQFLGGDITAAVEDSVEVMVQRTLPASYNAGKQLGAATAQGYNDGLQEAASSVEEPAKDITDVFKSAIKLDQDAAKESGRYYVDGLAGAIDEGITFVGDKCNEFGNFLTEQFNEGQGAKSPSKKTYQAGIWFVQGFMNAIRDNNDLAAEVTYSFGSSMVDALATGVSQNSDKITDSAYNTVKLTTLAAHRANEIVDSIADNQPVIRPVLDLSDVARGMTQLNAMMSAKRAYTMGGQIQQITAAKVQNQNGVNTSPTAPAAPSISLTQNNYSPKALSQAEIYRRTNNLFSKLAQEVKRV